MLVKKTGEDLGFEITIHANCRIRRVYFTDRLYSYQDLPKAFKVNISGQSQIVHSKNTGMADKSSPLPAGSGGPQGQGIELSKQPTGSDLQTSTAGHDCMRGIQSILNSTEKDPLKLWKKHVENGHVECVMDKKINSTAIDVHGGIME
ncbi:Cilia- and flagella-associated protein 20 [Takifugu flavidus]|uniref:Cilia-and flagella-associated protein 20 n=1 Tax=Takifugu flavidus TaxID=433684 RepID=A0A5C6MSQ6_9TELE|nr:Cilia- and flagella-associated protein 20 [Takifugu flavidus]